MIYTSIVVHVELRYVVGSAANFLRGNDVVPHGSRCPSGVSQMLKCLHGMEL